MAADKTFYGYVYDTHFQIALRNMRLMSFNPLVQGKIESTHSGCIVFLDFRLFILSRILLLFWTGFIIVAAIGITFVKGDLWFLLYASILLGLMHGIAWANFRLQIHPTKSAIFKLLEG